MKKNLFVLVDASQKIGSGHFMRCTTLSEKLKSLFNKIIFITSNESKLIINENKKIISEIIYIDSFKNLKLDNYTSEINNIKIILNEYHHDENFLLIDHYDIDANFETILKEFFKKIFIIDDLANRKHNCNLLIDHGYYKSQNTRYDSLISKNTMKLLGPKYAIINTKFKNENKTFDDEKFSIKNILITFGSVDSTNECEKVTDALCLINNKNFKISVIAGMYNPNFEYLEKKYKKYENIKIFRHVNEIEKLMSNSDLCFGAGGTTNFERFCSGLPSIVTIVADNQKDGVEYLSKMGHVVNLGMAKDVTIQSYVDKLKNLDLNLLCKMAKNNQKFIDGLGSFRIKKEISKMINDVS